MNHLVAGLCLWAVAVPVFALSIEDAQQRGQSTAEAINERLQAPTDPQIVPGYEASGVHFEAFEIQSDEAALEQAQENTAVQTIYEGMRSREPQVPAQEVYEREQHIIETTQANESLNDCTGYRSYGCQSQDSASTANQAQHNAVASAGQPPFSMFQGEKQQCTVVLSGVQNCCSLSISTLDRCNKTEYDLATARAQELTHYVGSHCTRRSLTVCLERMHSFCTYSSMLERITAQQLHQQFGLSFGNSQNSTCQGFSPAQMEQAQLDQLNLNEYYQKIEDASRVPDGFDRQALTRQTLDRVISGRQRQGGQE